MSAGTKLFLYGWLPYFHMPGCFSSLAAPGMQLLRRYYPVWCPWSDLCVLFIMVVLIVIYATQWYYLLKILGPDLNATLPYRYLTVTAVLLMVGACVTVSHRMWDIRWLAMVFVRVVAVLPYAGLLLFVGCPEGAAAPTLLFCLAAMVGCASFGSWTHELQSRVNF